jgi:hypothetical protein
LCADGSAAEGSEFDKAGTPSVQVEGSATEGSEFDKTDTPLVEDTMKNSEFDKADALLVEGGATEDSEFDKADAPSVDVLNNTNLVALHLDQTVGIKSKRSFLAHQVAVLYVDVPSDLVGGELELFMGSSLTEESVADVEPGAKLVPRENRLVIFRGDAYHRVKPFSSLEGGRRISIVLEAYKIPPNHYESTTRYEEMEGDHRNYPKAATVATQRLTEFVAKYGMQVGCFAILLSQFMPGYATRVWSRWGWGSPTSTTVA